MQFHIPNNYPTLPLVIIRFRATAVAHIFDGRRRYLRQPSNEMKSQESDKKND